MKNTYYRICISAWHFCIRLIVNFFDVISTYYMDRLPATIIWKILKRESVISHKCHVCKGLHSNPVIDVNLWIEMHCLPLVHHNCCCNLIYCVELYYSSPSQWSLHPNIFRVQIAQKFSLHRQNKLKGTIQILAMSKSLMSTVSI